MNQLKTGILLAGLTALLVVLGRYLGGEAGMVIAFGLALVMNAGAYWFSDRIVLSIYRAQPVTPREAPELYRMVERLCERARLPVPQLYVIPDPTPNAFATGRDPQQALNLGWAHGALLTTYHGDTTMATLAEVEAFAGGGGARVQR